MLHFFEQAFPGRFQGTIAIGWQQVIALAWTLHDAAENIIDIPLLILQDQRKLVLDRIDSLQYL
jgi:hypothetical protein